MNIKEKIKKHLSIKTLLFLAVPVFALGGFLLYNLPLRNKAENKSRTPSSYTLYTNEIESRAQKMMEESRRLHIIKDYSSANKTLSELLDKYPYTGHIEEASFLLAKGLFYEGEYQRSKKVIRQLRDDYDPHPRSRWLGYSLLLLGKIQEQSGKKDDSIRLYRQVINEFPDPGLVNEAEDLLMKVSL